MCIVLLIISLRYRFLWTLVFNRENAFLSSLPNTSHSSTWDHFILCSDTANKIFNFVLFYHFKWGNNWFLLRLSLTITCMYYAWASWIVFHHMIVNHYLPFGNVNSFKATIKSISWNHKLKKINNHIKVRKQGNYLIHERNILAFWSAECWSFQEFVIWIGNY